MRKTVIKGIFHSWGWGHYLLLLFISSSIFSKSLKHAAHYLFSQHSLSLSSFLFCLKLCVQRMENNSYYLLCGFYPVAGSRAEGPPWVSPVERQLSSRRWWRATPAAPAGRRAAGAPGAGTPALSEADGERGEEPWRGGQPRRDGRPAWRWRDRETAGDTAPKAFQRGWKGWRLKCLRGAPFSVGFGMTVGWGSLERPLVF